MNYEFAGFDRSLTDLFDSEQWAECLHATIQAYNVVDCPELTQIAVQDTGLIHELSHLASGIEICTHGSMAELRDRLEEVQRMTEK